MKDDREAEQCVHPSFSSLHPSFSPRLCDGVEGESGGRKDRGMMTEVEGKVGWVEKESRVKCVLVFMCPGRRLQASRWRWACPSRFLGWICGPAPPARRPGPALNLHAKIQISTDITAKTRKYNKHFSQCDT